MNDELRRYLDLCDSLDELDKKDKEMRFFIFKNGSTVGFVGGENHNKNYVL